MTCIQQSVMNFGILMVQGLVNSFGPAVMAAFAAAVKLIPLPICRCRISEMPTPLSPHRITGPEITSGSGAARKMLCTERCFSIVISLLVNLFAHPLMQIFVKASEIGGHRDRRTVPAAGRLVLSRIGWLFLLYGYYRAVKRAEMSVVLTVISLGMRVALAYLFSATALGVAGIWIAIPIGWALADMTGLFFLRRAFRSQKPA